MVVTIQLPWLRRRIRETSSTIPDRVRPLGAKSSAPGKEDPTRAREKSGRTSRDERDEEDDLLTPEHRRRTSHRPLVWLLAVLALLAAGAAALQIYTPRAAAAYLGSLVAENLHARASVHVQGNFWQIAQGAFQDLAVSTGSFTFQGYTVRSASLTWQDGSINLQELTYGQFQVLAPGRLRLTLVLDETGVQQALQAGLAQALPRGAALASPKVSISPRGITLYGTVDVLGTALPYRVLGDLVVQQGGRVLAFHALSLDKAALKLPPVPVLRMQDLPAVQGLPLHIAGVGTQAGAIVLRLAGPR